MVSTTTFGAFPGVRVQTVGNAVTGVTVGRRQKLVLYGRGGSDSNATVGEPTSISTTVDADRKFGEGSQLAEAVRQAIGNGTPTGLIRGVIVPEEEVTGESHSGSASFTLDNGPISGDLSSVTVTDTVDSTDLSVEKRFEDPLPQPTEENTAYVNPNTFEVSTDASSDYEVDYTHLDFDSAINDNTTVVNKAETGVLGAVTRSEYVAGTLSGAVNNMRSEYRMVTGVAGAQPNRTGDNGEPRFNTSEYTDSVDNDAMFLVGPTDVSPGTTLIGAAAGNMAGAQLTESIYNSDLTGSFTELTEDIDDADVDNLDSSQVIPIRQRGSISMLRNQSTSTEDGYTRDYFVRRVVDQAVLIAEEIGDSIVGRINDADTRRTAENQVRSELEGLASSGLIEPNGDEQNHFVEFYEIDQETVGVDLGITPNGITKRVDTTISIDV